MSKYKVGDVFYARITFVDMQGVKIYNGSRIELVKDLGNSYYDCMREGPTAGVTYTSQINDYELDTYCTDSEQTQLPIGAMNKQSPNSVLADELGAWGEISFMGDNDPTSFLPIVERCCECGSAAVGSDKHSTWCPLHV